MFISRKQGEEHINRSLKEIDPNSWLIGNLVLTRSFRNPSTVTWNDETDGSSYTLTEAPYPAPSTTLPSSSVVKLVHEAGDASAVWSIGYSAFCKVRYIERGVTPETVTLNFVRDQRRSFGIPEVLHHVHHGDRSYLFLKRLQGRTLDAAWPSLNESWRRHYVQAVVRVCEEMSTWSGERLCGVDGQHIPEPFLVTPKGSGDYSSLQAGCEAIGMDCSSFSFYHADLGPTNIIVEEEASSGNVGIIDFEIAGYFPRDWVRTKVRISSGLDLSARESTAWRAALQAALGDRGFVDYSQSWMAWRGYS